MIHILNSHVYVCVGITNCEMPVWSKADSVHVYANSL